MKKLIYIVLFFSPFSAFSQWTWQNPLPQGNILTSVYFTDTNHGCAVGESGTVVKTTDGGSTWTLPNSGTTIRLNSVAFLNANTGYAVGLFGTIIKTTDGGNTWNKVNSGTSQHLFSIFFVDSQTGYIASDIGKILKTTNIKLHLS